MSFPPASLLEDVLQVFGDILLSHLHDFGGIVEKLASLKEILILRERIVSQLALIHEIVRLKHEEGRLEVFELRGGQGYSVLLFNHLGRTQA